MQKNKRVFISLLLIIITCWIGYTIIYESTLSVFINHYRFIKHVANFLLLISIFIIGNWGLKFYTPIWIFSLWNISYLVIIVILLLLGILDIFLYSFLLNFKVAIAYLRFFFQSPMPYLSLLLISKLDFEVKKS